MLGSMSFVIFFTVLGIPFGRLADRAVRKEYDRRWSRGVESVFRSDGICHRLLVVTDLPRDGWCRRSDAWTSGVVVVERLLSAARSSDGAGDLLFRHRTSARDSRSFSAVGWANTTAGALRSMRSVFRGSRSPCWSICCASEPRGTTEVAYDAIHRERLEDSLQVCAAALSLSRLWIALVSRRITCRSGDRRFVTRVYKLDLLTIGFYGGRPDVDRRRARDDSRRLLR